MNFELTEEQKLLQQSIREFVKRECTPELMRKHDEEETYPAEIWRRLAEQGYMGVTVPTEYGGQGGSVMDVVLIVEELSRAMTALGTMFLTSCCFGANSVGAYGTRAQKAEFLPKIARGELRFCFGVTEPECGIDTLNLKTRAELVGDEFVINGQKIYITGADVADYIVLLCRTNPKAAKKTAGFSVILVPRDTPGVTVTKLPKLGLKAIATTQVFLEDVRVSREMLLGELNDGWSFILHTMNNERITVSAYRIGCAQAALDLGVSYAKERVVFGRPIGAFQANAHRLAESAVGIETARLLMYKAAWMQANGQPCGVEANMSKYWASEVALQAVDASMRTLAGFGYTMSSEMQRYLRDAWIGPTGTATNDMVKNFLAERLLGLPRSF